jgi:hypothetical protein
MYYRSDWTHGTRFRLDLNQGLSGLQAIVWGNDAVYTGTTTFDIGIPFVGIDASNRRPPTGPLTLSGDADVSWAFSLDDGVPAKAAALSYGFPFCGQSISSTQEFEGTVSAETAAPVFSVTRSLLGLDVALPWEDIGFSASEGIESARWMAHASATMNGAPVQLDPVPVPGTTETNQLRLARSQWVSRLGKTVQLKLLGGVSDAGGHAGNDVESAVIFADLGSPTASILFNSPAYPFMQGFTSRPVGDPACEPGNACAVAHFDSRSEPVAIAGRIITSSATSISVRLAFTNFKASGPPRPPEIRVLAVEPSGAVSQTSGGPLSWGEVVLTIGRGTEEVGVLVLPSVADCISDAQVVYDVAVGSITAK